MLLDGFDVFTVKTSNPGRSRLGQDPIAEAGIFRCSSLGRCLTFLAECGRSAYGWRRQIMNESVVESAVETAEIIKSVAVHPWIAFKESGIHGMGGYARSQIS